MTTRVCNLVFAVGSAAIGAASVLSGEKLDALAVVIGVVMVCWLAASIGLFFRSRLAWCGSLLGAGFLLSVGLTLTLVTVVIKPEAPGGFAALFGLLGILVAGALIAGLFRLRRTLPPSK
jgi:hypothetical protein